MRTGLCIILVALFVGACGDRPATTAAAPTPRPATTDSAAPPPVDTSVPTAGDSAATAPGATPRRSFGEALQAQTQAALSSGTCRDLSAVAVERRVDSADAVVMEVVMTFDAPSERARAMVWVEVDDTRRAGARHIIGDGVWSARCRDGCAGVTGDCPAPRLRSVPEPGPGTEVVSGTPARASALATRYGVVVGATSVRGGFEELIASDAVLEDVTSGRVRRGVDGFVDGLRAIERAFPGERRVDDLTITVAGDWLVARFSWRGTPAAGAAVSLRAAEIVRFDKGGKLVWSRGYAMVSER